MRYYRKEKFCLDLQGDSQANVVGLLLVTEPEETEPKCQTSVAGVRKRDKLDILHVHTVGVHTEHGTDT